MKEMPDIFVDFMEKCDKQLGFLEKKYKFIKGDPKQEKYEIFIQYRLNDKMDEHTKPVFRKSDTFERYRERGWVGED